MGSKPANGLEIKLSTADSDILVSFSRLNHSTFEEILDRFKRSFPQPRCLRWDQSQKAWRLNNRYAPYLLKFLNTTIGADTTTHQLPRL